MIASVSPFHGMDADMANIFAEEDPRASEFHSGLIVRLLQCSQIDGDVGSDVCAYLVASAIRKFLINGMQEGTASTIRTLFGLMTEQEWKEVIDKAKEEWEYVRESDGADPWHEVARAFVGMPFDIRVCQGGHNLWPLVKQAWYEKQNKKGHYEGPMVKLLHA